MANNGKRANTRKRGGCTAGTVTGARPEVGARPKVGAGIEVGARQEVDCPKFGHPCILNHPHTGEKHECRDGHKW